MLKEGRERKKEWRNEEDGYGGRKESQLSLEVCLGEGDLWSMCLVKSGAFCFIPVCCGTSYAEPISGKSEGSSFASDISVTSLWFTSVFSFLFWQKAKNKPLSDLHFFLNEILLVPIFPT